MRSHNDYFLSVQLADVTSTDPVYVPVPDAGKVVEITSVLHKAMGGGGNVTLTAKIGTTAITGGALTVTQAGSAAGDRDTVYPSAANNVADDSVLSITSDGGGAAAGVTVLFVIRR